MEKIWVAGIIANIWTAAYFASQREPCLIGMIAAWTAVAYFVVSR